MSECHCCCAAFPPETAKWMAVKVLRYVALIRALEDDRRIERAMKKRRLFGGPKFKTRTEAMEYLRTEDEWGDYPSTRAGRIRSEMITIIRAAEVSASTYPHPGIPFTVEQLESVYTATTPRTPKC